MEGTIHIFGYGETQLISSTVNFKAKTADLTKVQAVITDVKAKKPADKTASEHHAINIFGGGNVSFQAKLAEGVKQKDDNSSFVVKESDLSATKVNALVAELTALANA